MRRAAIIIVAVCVGTLGWIVAERMRTERVSDPPAGTRAEGPVGAITPAQERELHRIADLGYIAGRAPAHEGAGVAHHDAAAFPGYTLFTYAEGPEAVLVDMEGVRRHSWSRAGSKYWARAHAYSNGDLLVITSDPYRLMKIDRNSDVLWTLDKPAHHDFDVLADESIWVLVREATTREHIHGGSWLLDDVLIHLDPGGRELERVSLLEAFERSDDHRDWVSEESLPKGTDIFHTNSVEVVNGATVGVGTRVGVRRRDGGRRALVSIRSVSAIALVNLDSGLIERVIHGPWRMQHEAQLVDGNLLLFDNLGLDDRSRVMEIDIETSELVWSYSEPGFFSRGAGAQQRLPNGNTLVTESERGRIVEVTRSGEVVWEFINPRSVAGDGEMTLGIMRAERVPADFPLDWASGASDGVR